MERQPRHRLDRAELGAVLERGRHREPADASGVYPNREPAAVAAVTLSLSSACVTEIEDTDELAGSGDSGGEVDSEASSFRTTYGPFNSRTIAPAPGTTPLTCPSWIPWCDDEMCGLCNSWTRGPFASPITIGADHLTLVSTTEAPILAADASPKNAGVAIENVTDGHAGAAPDIGAIIEGRPLPQWGAQR